ncbi:hypothetical protein BDZ90DRAFT_6440 [Jaminaea rosea]|uniref:HORMA domain-containing protein n=1 Tax=Jaminaea rosea TaxID=1569628 RepID=A0A316UXY2_9BASI|nr:hypothetical protein BDZ90DRAFT_6440 [Jaminaea rosea]PWN30177.1 hypothetical protein BDZ90DRAFT_6440 [Jaminaea rosea]
MPALTRASQHRQCEDAAHSQAMPTFTTSNKPNKGATMIVRGNQAMLTRSPATKHDPPVTQHAQLTVVPSMVATVSDFITHAIGAILFARKIYPQAVYTPTRIACQRRGKEYSMMGHRLAGPTEDANICATLAQIEAALEALHRGYLHTISLGFPISRHAISAEGAVPLLEYWRYEFDYAVDKGPARGQATMSSIYDLLQTQQLTLAHQPSMPSGFYLQLKASLSHRAPPDYMPSGFFAPESAGHRWVLESSPDACETPTFQSYKDAGMEGYRASFTMARSRTNAYVHPKLRLEQMKGGERLLFDVNTAFEQQSAPSDKLGMSTLLGAGVSGGGSSDSVVSPCALIRADTRSEEPVPAHVLMEWEKKRPKDVRGEDLATSKPSEIFKAPRPRPLGATTASINEKLAQHMDSRPLQPGQASQRERAPQLGAVPSTSTRARQATKASSPQASPSPITVQCDCNLQGSDEDLTPCEDCGHWLHLACYGHAHHFNLDDDLGGLASSHPSLKVTCWSCTLARHRRTGADDDATEDERYFALCHLSQVRRAIFKLLQYGTWPAGGIERFAKLIGAANENGSSTSSQQPSQQQNEAKAVAQGLRERLLEEGFLEQRGRAGVMRICEDQGVMARVRERYFTAGGGIELEVLSEGWTPGGEQRKRQARGREQAIAAQGGNERAVEELYSASMPASQRDRSIDRPSPFGGHASQVSRHADDSQQHHFASQAVSPLDSQASQASLFLPFDDGQKNQDGYDALHTPLPEFPSPSKAGESGLGTSHGVGGVLADHCSQPGEKSASSMTPRITSSFDPTLAAAAATPPPLASRVNPDLAVTTPSPAAPRITSRFLPRGRSGRAASTYGGKRLRSLRGAQPEEEIEKEDATRFSPKQERPPSSKRREQPQPRQQQPRKKARQSARLPSARRLGEE